MFEKTQTNRSQAEVNCLTVYNGRTTDDDNGFCRICNTVAPPTNNKPRSPNGDHTRSDTARQNTTIRIKLSRSNEKANPEAFVVERTQNETEEDTKTDQSVYTSD